ncbi:cytochrome C oxidase subunit IV family protein [Planctomicrobium sp. SH664]|uniref:cytochrome C oxidase subunit IV family protein n=1 Tax=Planctomicrobium sp. SH664 TaxID=3448125 RepID=UPI003F5BED59
MHSSSSHSDAHGDPHHHLRAYYAVFAALILLVGVTIGVSMIPMGKLAAVIALAIATFKAVLIVLIFMHVKDEMPLIQVFAFGGFFWLVFLFMFVFSDYATRNVMHAYPQVTRSAAEAPDDPSVTAEH